jgi:hypothetical protein
MKQIRKKFQSINSAKIEEFSPARFLFGSTSVTRPSQIHIQDSKIDREIA